jgi:hypothetical protein
MPDDPLATCEIAADGSLIYRFGNSLHRRGGPAVVRPTGNGERDEWWVWGYPVDVGGVRNDSSSSPVPARVASADDAPIGLPVVGESRAGGLALAG